MQTQWFGLAESRSETQKTSEPIGIKLSILCVSATDLKLHLQSTDYGSFLANEASPLTVSVIDDKLKEKMVVEFRHMRNQSYEPLASFMDFIT